MTDLEKMRYVFTSWLKYQYDDRGRWAVVEEAELLYNLISIDKIKTVFEIGTANGWTSSWMALAGATVHTFDICNRPKVYEDKCFPVPVKERIHFTFVGSPECVELMKTIEREGQALFFIDGDHSQEGVGRDYEAVIPLLRSGDKVVFHDTSTGTMGVYNFWKKMKYKLPEQCVDYYTKNGMGVLTW